MTDPTKGNITTVDVDVRLSKSQRAILSAFLQQEGFDVLQQVMEDIVRNMNAKLLSVDPSCEKEVLTRHRVAYAAGKFYIDLILRLKEEFNIQVYNAAKLGTMENPENNMNVEEFQ